MEGGGWVDGGSSVGLNQNPSHSHCHCPGKGRHSCFRFGTEGTVGVVRRVSTVSPRGEGTSSEERE